MQDAKRIAVCRGAFLVLCVLPTLLTLAFIGFHRWSVRSPAAKAEWERELSQRLGVAVAIKGLSYPQPLVAELAGVKISDAETGVLLAECRRAEILHAGKKWNVTLIEPSAERNELGRLLQRLHDRVLIGDAPSLRLAATHMTLRHDDAAQSLHDVTAEIGASQTGPTVSLHFRNSPSAAARCELAIRRNRQITPPATQIEWNFADPVPARLASGLLVELSDLGPRATLLCSGNLIWQDRKLSGELFAKVDGIDLSRVVSEQFPHRLNGQGTLTLDRAVLKEGRLEGMRGTLVSEGGRISRSLITAAAEHLLLRAELPRDDGSITYERLAIGFAMTGEHLTLSGARGDDVVLAAPDGESLLTVPANHDVSALALVRMLVPDSQVQVPATKQTASLLRWLPIPSIDPPASTARSSHVPTRLGPATAAERNGSVIRERGRR